MNFADNVCENIIRKKSHIVVGLDPAIYKLPLFILEETKKKYGKTEKGAAEAFFKFNKLIIDTISDKVAIVKPQLAYYEVYGAHGIDAFWKTVDYAQQKGLIVIADAKRGDIDSTAAAYADAFFSNYENEWQSCKRVDALTINPYLGSDSLVPFINKANKEESGLFILAKTSNPSATDLQEQRNRNNISIAETVCSFITDFSKGQTGERGYSPIGAVVGATYPETLAKFRESIPHSLFLVPGYGAQGAKGKDITNAFNKDGLGALISSSRGIIYAYNSVNSNEKEVINSIIEAVDLMNEDINTALDAVNKIAWKNN